MKTVDYDLVIIGGGPAGLTAGLYAARARLDVVLLEKSALGGQIITTDWIENYPGFPEGISGIDLVQKMIAQVKRFDLPIETEMVLSFDVSGPIKKIRLSDKTITCRAIIITSGASPRKLGVPGESTYHGRGVSYCGTCDAPFFKDRVVAAVGGGDTAVQESIYLTKFVKKVYLVHRRDQLRAERILQERAFANPKIEFVWDSVVTGINGDADVKSVSVKNVKTGLEKTLTVDGCFIWTGILPNTDFMGTHVATDEFGFIKADINMETSVPGIFAAGDVRNTTLRQIATAVGDAALAAYTAEHYLEGLPK